MRSKKYFLFATIVLLLIGIINFYCRKCLPYSYAEALSYNQLYYPDESLHIASMQWDKKDSLQIIFAGKDIRDQNIFRVFNNSTLLYERHSSFLKIKLLPSPQKYGVLINSLPDTATINIDYTPQLQYRHSGNSSGASVEISNSNLLIGTQSLKNIAVWQWNENKGSSDERLINSYLHDSMKIADTDQSEERVRKIASYILHITKGKYGVPSDSFALLSPLHQLDAIKEGRSKLWCGNYAALFAFFALKTELAVRMIDGGEVEGGTVNSPHSFNEVYIEERKTWAYVDLTDGNILVKKRNKFLNAVDIYRLLRYNKENPEMVATYFNNEKLIDTPFYKTTFFGVNTLNHNNTLHFYYGNYRKITSYATIWERLRNFFYTKPYYAIYSDNISGIDWQFKARLLSTYLLLVCFIVWLFFLVKTCYQLI